MFITKFRERLHSFWRRYRFYTVPAVLVLVFLVLLLWKQIVITVEAGHSAVLWKRFFGGTVTDRVYGEGIFVIFPWDKMISYDIRLQETRHEMHVLTRNALTITLDLSIRYRPEREMLGILHKTIGQDYVRKIVVPEIESSLRTAIGGWDAESLYSTRRLALAGIIRRAIDNVVENYIIVDNVIIRKITFPALIADAIEKKQREKQLAEAYEYILVRELKEAERKRIEAEGYNRYNEILNKNLTDRVLKWKGVEATLKLAESNNTKIVLIGNSSKELPIILNVGDITENDDGNTESSMLTKPEKSDTPEPYIPSPDTVERTDQTRGGDAP